MIISGRDIAERIYARLCENSSQSLKLGILISGSDAVTDSFVRTKSKAAEKLGVEVVRSVISETSSTEEALDALATLARDCDGLIVQLPFPKSIDIEKVLAAIPPEKDVDGISASPKVFPPVAEAAREILAYAQVDARGKKAVVVGSGRLVGKPSAQMLRESGAEVTVVTHGQSLEPLKSADVIILGAGEPGLVTPEHIKEGVVLIDAGTSESSGKIMGDADPSCAEKAAFFTPVPGGVGPIAVAMIFKNLFKLVEEAKR